MVAIFWVLNNCLRSIYPFSTRRLSTDLFQFLYICNILILAFFIRVYSLVWNGLWELRCPDHRRNCGFSSPCMGDCALANLRPVANHQLDGHQRLSHRCLYCMLKLLNHEFVLVADAFRPQIIFTLGCGFILAAVDYGEGRHLMPENAIQAINVCHCNLLWPSSIESH